jgi:hypothetical protein
MGTGLGAVGGEALEGVALAGVAAYAAIITNVAAGAIHVVAKRCFAIGSTVFASWHSAMGPGIVADFGLESKTLFRYVPGPGG